MPFDPMLLDHLSILDFRDRGEAAAALDIAQSCERNIRSFGAPGQGRMGQGSNEPVSRMVLRPAGDLLLSYINDQVATTNEVDGTGLDMFCFTTVLNGEMDLSQDGRQATASGSQGLAFRTSLGTRFGTSRDNARLNLLLNAATVERALEAMLGDHLREKPVFALGLDWDRGLGGTLQRQIAIMLAEFGCPDGIATNPVALASFTDFIVQVILRGLPHSYSEQLAQGRHGAGPGYLRRAEDFMRAHAASPLRLDQIAAAAGCSVRTLSLVFRRFRETTPLAALHAFRLEAARAELLDETNAASAATIAGRHGFSNWGRFRSAYQRRFGPLPSSPSRKGHRGRQT